MLFGIHVEKALFLVVLVLASSRIRDVRACQSVGGPCKFDLESRVPWDNHYVDNRQNINCNPFEECYIENGESFTVRDGVCRLRDADLPIVVNDVDSPGSEQQLNADTEFECANGVLTASGGINVANVQSIKGCADSCVLTVEQLVNPINYGQCSNDVCPICVKDRDATPVDNSNICLGRQIEFITHTGKTVSTSENFVTAADSLTVECEANAFNEFHTNKVIFNGVQHRDIIAIRCVQSAADCPFTFQTQVPWDNNFVESFENLACIRGDQCFIENGRSITVQDGVCRLRAADLPIVVNGGDVPGAENQLVGDTTFQCTNGVLTASNVNFADITPVTTVTGCANTCILTMDDLGAVLPYGTCSGTSTDGVCLEGSGGGAQVINLVAICPGMQIEFIDYTGDTIYTSATLDDNAAESLTIECQNPQANEFHVNRVVFVDPDSPNGGHTNNEIVAIRCF